MLDIYIFRKLDCRNSTLLQSPCNSVICKLSCWLNKALTLLVSKWQQVEVTCRKEDVWSYWRYSVINTGSWFQGSDYVTTKKSGKSDHLTLLHHTVCSVTPEFSPCLRDAQIIPHWRPIVFPMFAAAVVTSAASSMRRSPYWWSLSCRCQTPCSDRSFRWLTTFLGHSLCPSFLAR